jgi:hypothetical protein
MKLLPEAYLMAQQISSGIESNILSPENIEGHAARLMELIIATRQASFDAYAGRRGGGLYRLPVFDWVKFVFNSDQAIYAPSLTENPHRLTAPGMELKNIIVCHRINASVRVWQDNIEAYPNQDAPNRIPLLQRETYV